VSTVCVLSLSHVVTNHVLCKQTFMIMIIMTVEKAGDYSKTGEFHDGRL